MFFKTIVIKFSKRFYEEKVYDNECNCTYTESSKSRNLKFILKMQILAVMKQFCRNKKKAVSSVLSELNKTV